jgi:hypothetical protein
LLDFLQGASNSAAGAVSGPIDLINMGLLGAGLPMPAAPFGGSQWMRQQGLMRDPQNRTAGLLGEAVGGVLPIVAAAKAPQIARGLLQAGDNLRAPTPMNTATRGQAGAIVYHASPHKFDRFDANKARTGEGANVYGAGTYFAESPAVSGKGGAYYQKFMNHPAARESGGPFAYLVDLPDKEIAKMLDWDKPWSQQPREVRDGLTALARQDEALMKSFRQLGPDAKANFFQAAISDRAVRLKKYEAMRAGVPESQAVPSIEYGYSAASDALRNVGIPGIRYLDDVSRGAGAGTSNYVVFPGNEGLLNILSRE